MPRGFKFLNISRFFASLHGLAMSKQHESPKRNTSTKLEAPEHLRPLYQAYSEHRLMYLGTPLTIHEFQEHAVKVVESYNDFHAESVVTRLEALTKPFVDDCRFWLGRAGSVSLWVEVPKGQAVELAAKWQGTDGFEEVSPMQLHNVKAWVKLWLAQLERDEAYWLETEGDPVEFRDGCNRLLKG